MVHVAVLVGRYELNDKVRLGVTSSLTQAEGICIDRAIEGLGDGEIERHREHRKVMCMCNIMP